MDLMLSLWSALWRYALAQIVAFVLAFTASHNLALMDLDPLAGLVLWLALLLPPVWFLFEWRWRFLVRHAPGTPELEAIQGKRRTMMRWIKQVFLACVFAGLLSAVAMVVLLISPDRSMTETLALLGTILSWLVGAPTAFAVLEWRHLRREDRIQKHVHHDADAVHETA